MGRHNLFLNENSAGLLFFDLAFLGEGLRHHHDLAMVVNPVSI
jgi:hypothetical protein